MAVLLWAGGRVWLVGGGSGEGGVEPDVALGDVRADLGDQGSGDDRDWRVGTTGAAEWARQQHGVGVGWARPCRFSAQMSVLSAVTWGWAWSSHRFVGSFFLTDLSVS
jgi:hypothetical protein